jgi:hypothetical protein
VPVDHDAAPAIARVPFGHQILIVSAELLGIGRTGGGGVAPDRRITNLEGAIDDFADGSAQCLLLHEAAFDVA